MITGIGTDLLHIQRFQDILESGTSALFINRVFTQLEQELVVAHAQPLLYWAGRFACKEAVFKALQTSWEPADAATDIEIIGEEKSTLRVNLYGRFKLLIEGCAGQVFVSLSHDGDFVLAFAAVEAGNNRVR